MLTCLFFVDRNWPWVWPIQCHINIPLMFHGFCFSNSILAGVCLFCRWSPKDVWLVVLTVLKNMKVNVKDYPIYEMENKKCLKPPTSTFSYFFLQLCLGWKKPQPLSLEACILCIDMYCHILEALDTQSYLSDVDILLMLHFVDVQAGSRHIPLTIAVFLEWADVAQVNVSKVQV